MVVAKHDTLSGTARLLPEAASSGSRKKVGRVEWNGEEEKWE